MAPGDLVRGAYVIEIQLMINTASHSRVAIYTLYTLCSVYKVIYKSRLEFLECHIFNIFDSFYNEDTDLVPKCFSFFFF